MTSESEIAPAYHQLVLVGYFIVIVVFLLLFLLYRERHQPRGHTSQNNLTVHGNFHFTPTVQQEHVGKGTPDKSKDPDPEDEKEEKSEASFKVSEEETPYNNEAKDGLRHRAPKRDSSRNREYEQRESSTNPSSTELAEKNGQRVFSRPVVTDSTAVDVSKAFLDTAPPNSDKTGETDPAQLNADRQEGWSEKHCSTTTIDEAKMMVQNTEVPTHETNSPSGSFTFKVDRRGCKVITRYCKINIPQDSITKPETITMQPHYDVQARSQGEVMITPYVTFKTHGGGEIEFTKDVTLALYTGYSAVDGKQRIPVQVLWKRSPSSSLKCIAETFLGSGSDKFISFTCRHFCGYCIAAEQSHFHCMRRHYFYAGFVRDSTAPTRIFHWMVFDDCPATYDRQVKYMREDKTILVVMDPNSFHVDYDYTLQMLVKRGEICPVGQDHENLKLHERWGSRVTHTYQFEISNVSSRSNENMSVHYKMMATHNRGGPYREVCEKRFFYEWKVPPPQPAQPILPGIVNVFDRGIGIQIGYANREQVQQQESVESGHSSGYGSPPPSGRTFSLSEAATTTIRQDFGFNDLEEAVTTPKSSMKPIGDPERHSTPRHSGVAPETDSLVPNVTRESLLRNSPVSAEHDSGLGTFNRSPRRSPEPESLAPMTLDNSGASISQPSSLDDGYLFGAVVTSDSQSQFLEEANADSMLVDVPADSFKEQAAKSQGSMTTNEQ